MSNKLIHLLRTGYFPKELPYCFNTKNFAESLKDLDFDINPEKCNKTFEICKHSYSKFGTTRRPLGLLNPIPFFALSKAITEDWGAISKKLDSPLSMASITLNEESPGDKRILESSAEMNKTRLLKRIE